MTHDPRVLNSFCTFSPVSHDSYASFMVWVRFAASKFSVWDQLALWLKTSHHHQDVLLLRIITNSILIRRFNLQRILGKSNCINDIWPSSICNFWTFRAIVTRPPWLLSILIVRLIGSVIHNWLGNFNFNLQRILWKSNSINDIFILDKGGLLQELERDRRNNYYIMIKMLRIHRICTLGNRI